MVASFPFGLTEAVTVVKLTAVVIAAIEYAHTLRAAMLQSIAAPIAILNFVFIFLFLTVF
jgi:hypothetical protein